MYVQYIKPSSNRPTVNKTYGPCGLVIKQMQANRTQHYSLSIEQVWVFLCRFFLLYACLMTHMKHRLSWNCPRVHCISSNEYLR